VSALRDVLSACTAASGGADQLTGSTVISDGEQVVIEAGARAVPGGSPVSCTFVLRLRDGLADEVRCYFDPRVVDG
jgi:ketosteroid isomerase-like protein